MDPAWQLALATDKGKKCEKKRNLLVLDVPTKRVLNMQKMFVQKMSLHPGGPGGLATSGKKRGALENMNGRIKNSIVWLVSPGAVPIATHGPFYKGPLLILPGGCWRGGLSRR